MTADPRAPEGVGEPARGRLALGAAGESLAAAWYERHGYEVLDRNWRCGSGEIDLVCRKDGVLVICEVKSRRSRAFGDPVEAVTLAKRRRIRRLAGRWLSTHQVRWRQVRFDVAGILDGAVEVIEDAF